MLGGYQILDLSGMSVSMGSGVSISDLNVLKQLLGLREHIEENYDYSKPLNKRLKAVMIRLRDAQSGEKFEGCLWGNLSIIDDNLSFNIDAIASVNPLKVLQINVVFEKKQDDDGNDYYDIKSAKYEFRGGEDVVTVTDIKNIPSAIINKLDCGDIVLKKDSSGLHAYIVSFRNATGICLTYTDASCIETQSYDKVGQNWVYNSEDKSILPEFAPNGTIQDVLGLDSEGKLVKGSISGGTKLYKHTLLLGVVPANGTLYNMVDNNDTISLEKTAYTSSGSKDLIFISNSNTPITSISELYNALGINNNPINPYLQVGFGDTFKIISTKSFNQWVDTYLTLICYKLHNALSIRATFDLDKTQTITDTVTEL